MNELDELRIAISDVDAKMAELFLTRMEIVKKIAEYKFANNLNITDSGRESEMLLKAAAISDNHEIADFYRSFMLSVIDISKKYQGSIYKNFNGEL